MENDYSLLVENLKGRRYDEALREPAVSDAFHQSEFSDCMKYALESMLEIDVAYAYKVYAIARKIHETISKGLKKRGYSIDYRYQGELKTYSNILLYGDVEIIVINSKPSPKPHLDIQRMAMDMIDILKGDPNFKSLDYSDKTRIRITALKPTCEIDLLPSVWVNSAEYMKTKNEIYRGIAEFDFKNKKVKKYLPFLNIARINARDQKTNGTFKCISRLLKTLRADCEDNIDLKDSEINSIVYGLGLDIKVPSNMLLSLLPMVSDHLTKLHTDANYFKALLSPSGKDRVFAGQPNKQAEIGKLNTCLSRLIKDLESDLASKNKKLISQIPYTESIN